MKVVNDTEVTKEAPGVNVVFTGSEPSDTPDGSITSWDSAEWTLATDSGFSADVQSGNVPITDPDSVQTGPGTWTLENSQEYYVRTRYKSSVPALTSDWSDTNHFKTAGGTPDIKDLFSTTVYAGNGGSGGETQVINTGVNNTVKSLVWIKSTDFGTDHNLFDTTRGDKSISSNATSGEKNYAGEGIKSFDLNGFTLGADNSYAEINKSGRNYVAWNWKAAPGFMDIQTWTGNGVAGRTMPHDLSSVPGMIIVKSTSAIASWFCYHQSLGNDYAIRLNSNDRPGNTPTWNNTSPTTTEFTLGEDGWNVNNNNEEYVGYLFADTPGTIKCGKYTGNLQDRTIETGFKPGWVMAKAASEPSNWQITDSKRGSEGQVRLSANTSDKEVSAAGWFRLEDNGFFVSNGNDPAGLNLTGVEYIYVAIADPTTTTYYDEVNSRAVSQHELVRRFGVDADSINLRNQGIYPLVNQPTGMTDAFVKEGDAYRAIPNRSMDVFYAQQEAAEANERLDDANEALETLRVGFEARIAALEAGY